MELYGLHGLVNKIKSTKQGKAPTLSEGELESILTVYKGRNIFEIVDW